MQCELCGLNLAVTEFIIFTFHHKCAMRIETCYTEILDTAEELDYAETRREDNRRRWKNNLSPARNTTG